MHMVTLGRARFRLGALISSSNPEIAKSNLVHYGLRQSILELHFYQRHIMEK